LDPERQRHVRGIEAEHQVRKPVESPATFAGTLMRYLAQ